MQRNSPLVPSRQRYFPRVSAFSHRLVFIAYGPSFRTQADTILPLSEPVVGIDGQLMSEIPVPKDTPVVVGIQACNRNKALWGDDALEWKPERWLSPLPDALGKAHVPGVYANL